MCPERREKIAFNKCIDEKVGIPRNNTESDKGCWFSLDMFYSEAMTKVVELIKRI